LKAIGCTTAATVIVASGRSSFASWAHEVAVLACCANPPLQDAANRAMVATPEAKFRDLIFVSCVFTLKGLVNIATNMTTPFYH
jgi:hypothetical protein